MTTATRNVVARNRRARHDYFIEEAMEAGIALTGTEVKSLRMGRASINEAYVTDYGGELYLEGAHIPEYKASRENHPPRRLRKLLVHKRELNRLLGNIQRKGYTAVPLSLYFNARGIAKVEIGLARGKRKVDKRETVKERDWQRRKSRILRESG